MDIKSVLPSIQLKLREHGYRNEASVSQGILLPILGALGWEIFDPNIVIPEYAIDSRRVDYALCHPASKPAILVEVKKVGKAENADEQLFRYAFSVGTPIVLLTDGRDWSFYLPSGKGNYFERRVYKLDILERSIDESEYRLKRYLSQDNVQRGDFLKNAMEDYHSIHQSREIMRTLPIAFDEVVKEGNQTLIGVLREKVADICGGQASDKQVSDFLKELVHQNIRKNSSIRVEKAITPVENVESESLRNSSYHGARYALQFQEKTFTSNSAIGLLRDFFDYITVASPNFGANYMKVKHGKKRRYLAASPNEIYPNRPDFVRDKIYKLKSGLYIGTNLSGAIIKSIIIAALEANNFHPERDFQLTFDV